MCYKKLTTEERDAKRISKRERIAEIKEQVKEEYEGYSLGELASELNNIMDSEEIEESQIRVKVLQQLIKDASPEMLLDFD